VILEISQKFSNSFSVHLGEVVLMAAVHEDLNFCAVKLSNLCYDAQMLTRFEPTQTIVQKILKYCAPDSDFSVS